MRRPFFRTALAAMLLATLCVAGCSREPRHPNVLLLSIDTLRADHLGCYGGTRVATPNVDRLARKEETARGLVPGPVFEDRPGAKAGLLAFGTSHYGTTEGRDRLEREHGLPLDYARLRALPFSREALEWIARHEVVYVVEQNRDAQLATLLRDEAPGLASRLVSVLQYDGLPFDATTVVEGVLSHRARVAGGAR